MCLDTWHRIIPDYQIKVWDYDMAKAIGIPFIDEALEEHRWAFAADAVRFYAVWKEGGVYMDSDILLLKRFDDLVQETGMTLFNDTMEKGIQAAFFIGEAGNSFCKDLLDYYRVRHYRQDDGSQDNTISPQIMAKVAERYGYKRVDTFQNLESIRVYPTRYVVPRKRWPISDISIAQHQIYGSWRKRKLGRKIDLYINHLWNIIKYNRNQFLQRSLL